MNFPPQAYIIGAAKAGTTTLADLLGTHPDIELANPKEPDYFAGHFDGDVERYKGCFRRVGSEAILVDASTSYAAALWDAPGAWVAQRIAAARPDARLVMMVRDPVERAWSSYWHAVRAGEEKRSFRRAMQDRDGVHISAGLYYQRSQEFLSCFPREALRVLDFRDLARSPQAVAAQVAAFLGADPARFPDSFASDAHRNASFRWNRAGTVLRSAVGLGGIRVLNRLARAACSPLVYQRLKGLVSTAMPRLEVSDAQALCPLFADDARCFFEEFGVETRTGVWWQPCDGLAPHAALAAYAPGCK
jgi:hypothetical protein